MNGSPASTGDGPSLEALVESGAIDLEILHPGGLRLTSELADLCGIAAGTRVLDVACGTGESACHLAGQYGAAAVGVDVSAAMLARARQKAGERRLDVRFVSGEAVALPFVDAEFAAVICECTLCLLDKPAVLREMMRVARPGGFVGIHDLSWHENAPGKLKRRLAELEDEYPETLDGWRRLFEQVGMVDVVAMDRSWVKQSWMRDVRRELGVAGQLALVRHVFRRWGFNGLLRIFRSERVFSSSKLGYALVVGRVTAAG